MKINDIIHGFKVIRVRQSEELSGTLYEMEHIKTKAQLAWLDNGEDNKLFSVAFKTLPWDDTGVFHILEHSVLAGSENYPVKEPFLDLLKSSMNTFLNAMTFPDKTMYPVSSRNQQDFINLTRVYLDAVFRPAIYKNESIFRQEGWHYEFGEDGEPFYNGVVFNEMKGALGSADGQIEYQLKAELFKDSFYGYESGGDPKAIPNLTYENFLKAHREFYSPSNARIYLDGAVPLVRVLSLIDGEYLSTFDYIDKKHDIVRQGNTAAREIKGYYEIGKEESEENKTQIVLGKIFATWEERKKITAYNLISSYLAGSNEAPLKRAVLEKGLAQDMEFDIIDGIDQPYYCVIFRNTEPDKKDEIKALYRKVLGDIIEKGIDIEELTACLNQYEFSLREPEEPKGLTRNINALNSWLYGGDMLLYLENNSLLSEMRRELDSDYYLDIIKELADSEGEVLLTLLPSKTKGDEERIYEEQRVRGEVSAFSADELKEVKDTFEKMRLWQDMPDSPEASATLPVLSLSDVSPKPQWLDTEVIEKNGVKVLFHKLSSNGIVHCNLYFNASDESPEALSKLSFITELLGVLPTSKHTSSELQKEIKMIIGSLDFDIEAVPDYEDEKVCTPYFTVSFSVLENNLEAAVGLIAEILLETDFDSKELIYENLLQVCETVYQSVMGSGHLYAFRRALSHTSAVSAVQDMTKGYALYRSLDGFKKAFESEAASFISYAKERTKELFTKSRLVIGETAQSHSERVCDIADSLSEGSIFAKTMKIEPDEKPAKEAILIPAGVSYAAYGANIKKYGYEYEGMLTVTSLLLTYGYLWNEIRVHGGAYGCGFRAAASGNVTFHSFRDPNPLNSLEVYKNTGEFIKSYVEGDEGIEKYIISSIAATEGLMSTAAQGRVADTNCLSGFTYEDKLRVRTQMLSLKKEELLKLCGLFEKMKEGNSVCIIGNEDALKNLEGFDIYRL